MTDTESSSPKVTWLAALGLLVALSSPLGAAPQDTGEKVEEKLSGKVDWKLWSRGREVLHNGDPLDIVGLEEGDNGFRHSTPILEQSDRSIAMVDADENYRRRIAMYGGETSFHHPLPAASGTTEMSLNPAAVGPTPSPPAVEGQAKKELRLWLVFLTASLVLILLLFVRWRRRGGLIW